MKILKYILGFFLVIILISVVGCSVLSKKLPAGEQPEQAELLADKMLGALNKPAYDSLKFMTWQFFAADHTFVWDKQQNFAQIKWKNYDVRLNLDEVNGVARKDGAVLQGDDAQGAIDKAWSYWCNDSFWMLAPFKIKDPGTNRTIVKEDGRDNLLVTYSGGGVTPGDSYLWYLDDNFRPSAFRMWVKVLPLKGLKVPWTDYVQSPGGAWFATGHPNFITKGKMKNVAFGNSLSDLNLDENLFQELK